MGSGSSSGSEMKRGTTTLSDGKRKYKDSDIVLGDFNKLTYRLNPTHKNIPRIPTKIPAIDEILGGGLSKGLNIFLGPAGSGKSLLAREISKQMKTAYVCCEVISDSPDHNTHPNVTTVDYTRYLPKPYKAIEELFTIVDHLNPDLVVIDSLTGFFSASSKALPESDVREMVWKVHTACDGNIPIIGVSEVRGQGFSRAPAGGQGVMHGCSLLCEFDKTTVKYDSMKELYKATYGEVVYTLQVLKDKNNQASTKLNRLYWNKEEGYKHKIIGGE